MVTLWNRHRTHTVIDLTTVLDGPAPLPPRRQPDPPVLELRVEQRGSHAVLLVENRSDALARHVVVRAVEAVGPGATAGVVSDRTDPVHLPPSEAAEYRVFLPEDCAPRLRCQVSWRDGGGQHIAYQTVRLPSLVG